MPVHWHQSLHYLSTALHLAPVAAPANKASGLPSPVGFRPLLCARLGDCRRPYDVLIRFLGGSSVLTAAVRGFAYPARLLRVAVDLLLGLLAPSTAALSTSFFAFLFHCRLRLHLVPSLPLP